MADTDVELVALARTSNDERAFSALVSRHQARLRAFLRRICGDDSLADDIAQIAFMKAHAKLQSFKGGGSFRSWLYAIAYREFLQDRRRERAKARMESVLREETQAPENNRAGKDNALSIDLRRALFQLKEHERTAIMLCDAAGFTHSEAARAMDIPLGTVKSHVLRGREKLRATLGAANHEQEQKTNLKVITGAENAV